MLKLSQLVGKTISNIDRADDDRVRISFSDGSMVFMGPDGMTTDHRDRDGEYAEVYVDV